MEELTVAARFESAGDVRKMSVGGAPGAPLVLREEIEGASVRVAHGADRARLDVRVPASCTGRLLAALGELFGARSLAEFARDEGNDILDLMDLCDREGIPYDFGFIDSNEDAALRRADL